MDVFLTGVKLIQRGIIVLVVRMQSKAPMEHQLLERMKMVMTVMTLIAKLHLFGNMPFK